MKKVKLLLLIALSVFLVTSCSNKKEDDTKENTKAVVETNNEVEEENDDTNTDGEGFNEGNTAPDFDVKILGNEKVKLSDYRGKPVLLNFWATWCPPCKKEMPDLQKLHEEFGEELVILAVDIGEETTVVEEFIEENGYTFNIGLDPMTEIKYPIMSLPTTFLIDREGKITLVQEGVMPSMSMYDFYKPHIEEIIG